MAQQIETLTIVTFLGIRFWDSATNQQVIEGLQVLGWPETAADQVTYASRTTSGNYAFHGLSGMWSLEHPLENDFADASPPAARAFLVEIRDRLGLYLPSRFRVELPLPYKGLYRPSGLRSPLEETQPRYYLFSSPGRLVSPGLTAVRGCLTEESSGKPAAYALVEIEVSGHKWYGLCDDRGCLAVLFPYPTFITQVGSSPPGLPISHQVWPMTVQVYYDRGLAGSLGKGEIPTLAQIRSQPQAYLLSTEFGPAAARLAVNLVHGQEAILRTGNQSYLWITPGP